MDEPMVGYSVAHLDDIEELNDAGCRYRPIRHHLGITAFGVTAWTGRAAGDLVINEHDADDPTADQELFLVVRHLACCESLCNRTSDALEHLRHAVEMSEEFRATARTDSDLDPIRDEPVFQQLIDGIR